MRSIKYREADKPVEYDEKQRVYHYRGYALKHGIWTGEHGWYTEPLCVGDELYPTLKDALIAIDQVEAKDI